MLRRSVHERIGLDDPTMVRAPDYELWTRALYKGCRFGVLQEPLTFYRLHDGAVTHGDPWRTFLEICYLIVTNIIPIIEKRATFDCFCKVIDWVVSNNQYLVCQPEARYRLLGAITMCPPLRNFTAFQELICVRGGDQALTSVGRRLFVAFMLHPSRPTAERFSRDINKFIEARDFWHRQSDNWEHQASYWHTQSDRWERECRKLEVLYQQKFTRRLAQWARKKML